MRPCAVTVSTGCFALCMHACMHACRDTQIQTDRETDTHTHTETNRQRDRETHTHTLSQTDRQTLIDRQTDTHRQTDGRTDRHRQTHRQTLLTLHYLHTIAKDYKRTSVRCHFMCRWTRTVRVACKHNNKAVPDNFPPSGLHIGIGDLFLVQWLETGFLCWESCSFGMSTIKSSRWRTSTLYHGSKLVSVPMPADSRCETKTEIVFEIAGGKLWRSAGEKLLGSWTGLNILGTFRGVFQASLFVSHFICQSPQKGAGKRVPRKTCRKVSNNFLTLFDNFWRLLPCAENVEKCWKYFWHTLTIFDVFWRGPFPLALFAVRWFWNQKLIRANSFCRGATIKIDQNRFRIVLAEKCQSEKTMQEGELRLQPPLAHQNRTIAIASDFGVDGAKSPEVPRKEGVLGSGIAARNRKLLATFHRTLKSQCGSEIAARNHKSLATFHRTLRYHNAACREATIRDCETPA